MTLTGTLLALRATAAHAQSVSEADREARMALVRSATAARESGRLCEALSLVRRAEGVGPTAGTRLMTAEIRQELGRYAEAYASAEQCLAEVGSDTGTTAANREAIRARCASIQASLRPYANAPAAGVSCGEASEGSTQRVLGLVAGGVGVALLGAAVVSGAVFQGAADDYEAQRCAYASPTADCQSRYDRLDALNIVQWVGYIGGGALVGTGLALFFTAPRAPSGATAFACRPGPGAVGISCGATF